MWAPLQQPLISSAYIRPRRIEFVQEGKPKTWDFVEAFSSVAVLLHHRVRNTFIVVRQFRPPVWATEQNDAQRLANGSGSPVDLPPHRGL